MVLSSERVVIPQESQATVQNNFHRGHPGTNKIEVLARSYVYRPLRESQISQFSKSHGLLNCPSYLCSRQRPTEPWSIIKRALHPPKYNVVMTLP
ncbi:hypothetical protein CLF_108866 [Clonorchis sinensis]|uniref:Integrase zinc-binding domain-containing protein n=1 Tax=Clonorchis sinensis TaxID=79923 RepID=G7YIN5_CLOSI|nr:hypothetical protein CLF_108866 [Clonorchis sinensis]